MFILEFMIMILYKVCLISLVVEKFTLFDLLYHLTVLIGRQPLPTKGTWSGGCLLSEEPILPWVRQKSSLFMRNLQNLWTAHRYQCWAKCGIMCVDIHPEVLKTNPSFTMLMRSISNLAAPSHAGCWSLRRQCGSVQPSGAQLLI